MYLHSVNNLDAIRVNTMTCVFLQNKVRDNVNVIYNTSLPVIFGIPKYAAALNQIVRER